MRKEDYIFFTNDVETTSLRNHCLSDKTGEKILKEGMPLLLMLYEKYNIKSTFFFTGYVAQKFPDIVKMILPYGHEVGCHGYTHDSDKAFDILNKNEQIYHLQKAKEILEKISGIKVISFRAPSLRVNKYTPEALIESGFKIDSSVSPQRGDFMFSFGISKKFKWLFAPRKSYFVSTSNLARKGKSSLLEIPIISYVLPYLGTFMRISPFLTKILRLMAHIEAKYSSHIPVFVIHPNELIDEELEINRINRRAKSYISYLLADKLRYQLKLKNLGLKALPLYEQQLRYFYHRDYRFITFSEYYQKIKNE